MVPIGDTAMMRNMAKIPDSTQTSLRQRLLARAEERWPQIVALHTRYRASHDDFEQAVLPNGWPSGTPEEALDTACGLYLNDPTAWLPDPRRTSSDTH